MHTEDKTWIVTMQVRVTTMSGWKPDRDDIDGWMADGETLELVSVTDVKEDK